MNKGNKKGLEGLILNDTDILIKPDYDFYKSETKGGFNTGIDVEYPYEAGIIVLVGKKLPKEWVGKLIVYMKNTGVMIKTPSTKEEFLLLNDNFKYLIDTLISKTN